MKEEANPSLACFYYAQAKKMMNDNTEAMNKLLEGISYNQVHYRCLVGLFEIYLEMERPHDAYDIVKKILLTKFYIKLN